MDFRRGVRGGLAGVGVGSRTPFCLLAAGVEGGVDAIEDNFEPLAALPSSASLGRLLDEGGGD